MQITRVRLGRLRIPLKRPFRTALRSVDEVDDRIVCIESGDGLLGYGSAPATPQITGATHPHIEADWQRLAPALLGREVAALGANCAWLQATAASSNARAAFDVALHDLRARQLGLPLHCLLASVGAAEGACELRTDLTISANELPQMLADVQSALEQGYSALKLKLGRDVAGDLARIRAIHALVGDRASLRLDANQGWDTAQALTVMGQLEGQGMRFEWLEQPLPAADLAGMAGLTLALQTALLADESVHNAGDLPALLEQRAAPLLNIKLAKAGGLAPGLELIDQARAAGLDCVLGCMLESPVGVAAAAHLAVARQIERVDLDAPALACFDPVRGNVRFAGPRLHIGSAPGLGIESIDGLEWLAEVRH